MSALLALAGMCGCQYIPGTNAALEREAKDAVTSKVNDPGSVIFRNVATYEKAVCGEFNAKNGFGGYGPFHRFVYETSPTKALTIEPAGGPGASNADTIMIELVDDLWKADCKA
jgi:hypothetical protein